MLDMQGSKDTIEDAIGDLAAWIESCEDKLTEDDLAILAGIGGILYREGLNKRSTESGRKN